MVTLTTLSYVISQLDFTHVNETLHRADLYWLFAALLVFNASKVLSSLRLNHYFNTIGLGLDERYNLMLYYIGMFYNLFLPGGISGDGYKVYVLHKYKRTPFKTLLQAVLLDRISGLSALIFLACILFIFSSFMMRLSYVQGIIIPMIIFIFPATYLLNRFMFNRFIGIFKRTALLGIAVQLLQLLSAVFIVYSLNVQANSIDYLTLFLVSSIISVLPISIGGVGMRELTFLYGFGLLNLNANDGIIFSFIFFLITVISSAIGAFFLHKVDRKEDTPA